MLMILSKHPRLFVYEVYARYISVAKLGVLQNQNTTEFWGRVQRHHQVNNKSQLVQTHFIEAPRNVLAEQPVTESFEEAKVPTEAIGHQLKQNEIQTAQETAPVEVVNLETKDNNRKNKTKKSDVKTVEVNNIETQKENGQEQPLPEIQQTESKQAIAETANQEMTTSKTATETVWSRHDTTQDANGRNVEVYRARPPKFLGNPPILRQRPPPPDYLKPTPAREETEKPTGIQTESDSQQSEAVAARRPEMLANLARMFPEKNDPVMEAAKRDAIAKGKTLELEPATLSESTRRFLKPLIGTDPARARVWRGPDALLAKAGASAATVGQDVVLPESFNERDPNNLALLAHELHHANKRGQPRFVAPIVQKRVAARNEEESVALQLESAVLEAAKQKDAGKWNGLPAPWEAMPEFVKTPPSEIINLSGPPNAAEQIAQELMRNSENVRRAETGRSLPTNENQKNTKISNLKEADVEVLAQQVYALVKRRIATERRRSKGR